MPDVNLTYAVGTCSVAVAGTTVTGVSTLWGQSANVRQWDLISIDGGPLVPIVASAVDDTHITIPAWAGAVKAGVSYVIYQVSPLRFVGGQAMADVDNMLALLNTDGWYRYVNPAFAGPTEQGITANEGQFALKYTTGQLWIMTSGAWVLVGTFKPFGIAAPYDNTKTYTVNDVATLNGSSYLFVNSTPSAGHTPPNATFWAVLASVGATPWLPAVAWTTGVAMVAGPPATLVSINNATYVCLVSHTSGTFATDLAAGKWGLVSASPFLPLAAWATGVAMVAGPPASYISNGGSSYICLVSHTSGTFATDLAAGKWDLVASIGSGYLATSTTSLALSVASKVFTTQAGLAYLPGARIRLSSAANTNNYMEGIVTAYAGTSMTCNVTRIAGSGGPFADWNLNCVGDPGAGDLLSTNNLSDVANAATSIRNLGGIDVSNITSHSSAATLTSTDFNKTHLITGAAAFTLTLPTPVGNGGAKLLFIVDRHTAATKLYTLTTPSGVIGRSGASIVMWASESVVLRSDGTNWVVIDAKQIPFVGELERITDVSLSVGTATQYAYTSANGDPTSLNIPFVSGNWNAPRAGRFIFSLYAYQTSSGASFNQAFLGNVSAAQLGPVFSWTGSVNAGTVYGTSHITVAAGDLVIPVAQVNGSGPTLSAGTVFARLDYAETVPSW